MSLSTVKDVSEGRKGQRGGTTDYSQEQIRSIHIEEIVRSYGGSKDLSSLPPHSRCLCQSFSIFSVLILTNRGISTSARRGRLKIS